MDWPATIERLLKNGWTQKRLADECGCAQATISDLARGKTAAPLYPVGKKLEELVAALPAEAPAPAPAEAG
jgi:transcriptional regulator with XRE-family HTH domain